jgi:CubicO group peptidase (beta-lactamase class C family)
MNTKQNTMVRKLTAGIAVRTKAISWSLMILLAMAQIVLPVKGSTIWGGVATQSQVDLAGVKPKTFDAEMIRQLEAYITDLMRRAQVPGASVAIVQNGKAFYMRGFGVRELGKPDSVTPQTLMMIGSTGKSMTTMMMAVLVDDGKISWDTPAAQIYPNFVVSDPLLTPKITLRDLVCNCTGMQRHDLEVYFASNRPDAKGVIRSLRDFSFTGEFGKTFGYVNQMVGSGGYIAAWAARGTSNDLYANYLSQMQRRVFDPIGMASTTFSFARVRARPNHATPHGLTADDKYVPISLKMEQSLEAIAPAGASWSNVEDMARYLITQLHQGVAPNGRRVVSAANLKVTWQPQVEISHDVSYGLGWAIAKHKGQRLLTHGGGTNGFSSDISFLPDADLGVVILTNAMQAQLFVSAVRSRVLELAFGQPAETNGRISAKLEQDRRLSQDKVAKLRPLDPATVAPYQGAYTNTVLGEIHLTLKGDKLMLNAGGFSGELRSLGNATYIIWDPPLAGGLIKFTSGDQPEFVYDPGDPDTPERYTFTRVPLLEGMVQHVLRHTRWFNFTHGYHPLSPTTPREVSAK